MSIPYRFGSGKIDWDISAPILVFRIMCHATTEQHEYSPSMGGSLVPVHLKEMDYVAAMGFVNILSWGISFCCMFQTNVTKPLFFGEMFTAEGLLASLIKTESPEVKHMEVSEYIWANKILDMTLAFVMKMHSTWIFPFHCIFSFSTYWPSFDDIAIKNVHKYVF